VTDLKLYKQYLQLYSSFGENGETFITMDELAEALECTHRNMLFLLNRMRDKGWIVWTPSHGRGRRSHLSFHANPEEIALQLIMKSVTQKDIQQVLGQIGLHSHSYEFDGRLQQWLLTYFGHSSAIINRKLIDILRLPIGQKISTLDPIYTNLLAESFISSHVFDGLVRRDEHSSEVIPNVAHAWEIDKNRKRWTFFLRKGITFHNGKELDAEDVVYTLERLLQSSHRMLYRSVFSQICSVRATDPMTIHIELQEQNELFLPFLCTNRAAIVPNRLAGIEASKFGTRPIGTGPFKIDEMSESACSLEVFPHYYAGRSHLDRVEILHVPFEDQQSHNSSMNPFQVIHNPNSLDYQGEAWNQIHSDITTRKFVTCNTQKSGPLTDYDTRSQLFSCLYRGVQLNIKHEPDHILLHLELSTIEQYKLDADTVSDSLNIFGHTCHIELVSPEDFKGSIRLQSDLILFSIIRDQDEQLRLYDLYSTLSEHVEAHTRTDIQGRLQCICHEPDTAMRAQYFQEIENQLIHEKLLFILGEKPIHTAFLPSVRGVTMNAQGWIDLRSIWFPPRNPSN
jgi:SgrR family transcriptional regulator